jgi:hypothetical protein
MKAYDEKSGAKKSSYGSVIPETSDIYFNWKPYSPQKRSNINNPVLLKGDLQTGKAIRVPIILSNNQNSFYSQNLNQV